MTRLRLTALVAGILLGNAACLVDLERDDSVLLLFVQGASDAATAVRVQIDDGADLPPFEATFPLTDEPLQVLPAISVASGTVTVTGVTVDAAGATVDGPIVESTELIVRAQNSLQLDFSQTPGASPNPDPGGSARAEVTGAVTVDTEPEGTPWSVSVPIGPAAWTSAVGSIEDALGGPATRTFLRHVTVVSRDVSAETSAETFDELWGGAIRVELAGGAVTGGLDLPVAEVLLMRSSMLDIDLSSWRPLPPDARVTLTGPIPDDDEPDLPARIEVRLELEGRR